MCNNMSTHIGRVLIRGPPGGGVFQDLLNLKLLVLMSAPPIYIHIYIYMHTYIYMYIYICIHVYASVMTREEVKEGSEGNHTCHSSIEIEQEACYGILLILSIK